MQKATYNSNIKTNKTTHATTKFLFFIVGVIWFAPDSQAKFADIDITHPYFQAINKLEKDEVISGYQDHGASLFRPKRYVNRAEALKILLLAAKIPIDNKLRSAFFPDIHPRDWFFPYIQRGHEQEIIEGFDDGTFHPEKHVTRAEFLKMLITSFRIDPDSILKKETDAKQSNAIEPEIIDLPDEEVPEVPEITESELEYTNLDEIEQYDSTPNIPEFWFTPFIEVAKHFNLLPNPEASAYESMTRGEVAELIYRTQKVQDKKFKSKYRYSGEGIASYYDKEFAGKLTASREIYDPLAITAAHRTLPFGTQLKVWNTERDFVIVRINDRGPYHEERVLDLSRTAFEKLAPISKGVIQVEFQVFSEKEEEYPTIPEQIRPSLNPESREKVVPKILAETFTEKKRTHPSTRIKNKKTSNTTEKRIIRRTTRTLNPNPIIHLPQNFFPSATLRKSIPQKIIRGTVSKIAGIAKKENHKKATIFLQNKRTLKQEHFPGSVSGKNFSIPVSFLKTGIFDIGLVFDDQLQSRVGEIEVIATTKKRRFKVNKESFASDIDARLIPEESRVLLSWATGKNRLTKIIFSQGNTKKALLIEDELPSFSVPFDFFQTFKPREILSIELYQATSENSTIVSQKTNWEKITSKDFLLLPGFLDKETPEISIPTFSRYPKSLEKIKLEGQILSKKIALPAKAFLITPKGAVQKPLGRMQGDRFNFYFTPPNFGTYVFEVVSAAGEILFNRAIYVYKENVLPVFPWDQTTVINTDTIKQSDIRKWINRLRKNNNYKYLHPDQELDYFAQTYAEKMAHQNFISHTSPEGFDFEKRVKMQKLPEGDYGENLGFGTTLELALQGLENSGSHRKNILDKNWTHVGVGLARNNAKEYYIVQVFAKKIED